MNLLFHVPNFILSFLSPLLFFLQCPPEDYRPLMLRQRFETRYICFNELNIQLDGSVLSLLKVSQNLIIVVGEI